jgi:hypothetical protein
MKQWKPCVWYNNKDPLTNYSIKKQMSSNP